MERVPVAVRVIAFDLDRIAVLLRPAFNEAKQFHAVGVGDLVLSIVLPPVGKSHQAMFYELIGDPVPWEFAHRPPRAIMVGVLP